MNSLASCDAPKPWARASPQACKRCAWFQWQHWCFPFPWGLWRHRFNRFLPGWGSVQA